MMNPFDTLKNAKENAPYVCVIATGGGAGIQQRIWNVPGISNFFVEALMPYKESATTRILGFTPQKWVCDETAVDLAQAAYLRAYEPGRRALGIGVTCSLTSTRKHRGENRIVVAGFTENACYTINLVIPKGDFWDEDRVAAGKDPLPHDQLQMKIEVQRIKDGKLADELALHLLDAMIGGVQLNNFQCLCELIMGEPLPEIKIVSHMELARSRVLAHPFFMADGRRGTLEDIVPTETVFCPGAYNPPHEAHVGAAKAAMKIIPNDGIVRSLVFSTTVTHPVKDPLTAAEMLQRAAMMRNATHHNFLLTEEDGLYLDKAKKFPGAHFIMGADAMHRMLDAKWGYEPMDLIEDLHALGTQILVPGRLVDGVFMTRSDVLRAKKLDHDPIASTLFINVDYRLDISSSELRARIC